MSIRIASVLAFMFITSGLTINARADVSMISKEPTAITPKEAGQVALKGEVVSACQKVIFNTKNGRQKPVKGATVVYTKGLPKHEDAASIALLDGKQVYSCKTKEFNVAEGKFKNN